MEDILRREICRVTPKFNYTITEGLATKVIPLVVSELDTIFRAGAESFPPNFKFLGIQFCTPEEQFAEETKERNNVRRYETAKSTIRLVKLLFELDGVQLPWRPLYIPFVLPGGLMELGGAKYSMHPILSDKVISPMLDSVFIRLQRDKITIHRISNYSIVMNGRYTNTPITWSKIYHTQSNQKAKQTVKAQLALAHYLFCKYGVTKTFSMYANTTPIIGTNNINEINYPPNEWVIFESTKLAPKGVGRGPYTGTNIKMAIRLKDYSPMVLALVSGFFYVVDHFPDRFMADPKYYDSTRLWIILFGTILFSGVYSENKLFDDVMAHFNSLDEYVDATIQQKLRDIKYNCNTIYDLFATMLVKFNDLITGSATTVNSMYNKELSILYPVLEPINNAFYRFVYKVKAMHNRKGLNQRELTKLFNKFLKPGLIFSLTRAHPSMATVSYSGDNKFPRITSVIVPQSSNNGPGQRRGRASLTSPMARAHQSLIDVGNYCAPSKADPTGWSKINPYVCMDRTCTVIPNPKFVTLLNSVQVLLT